MQDDKRRAALEWAARGFRVFPLRENTKAPLADGWTEWATSDAGQITRLWSDPVTGLARNYNVGVLTNELIVVDVDNKAGKDGGSSFAKLGLPTNTLVVATPSGGYHVYYSGPNRSLSAGKLGEGLDVRSYHGYVVAPGSWLDGAEPSNKGSHGYYTIAGDAPVLPAPTHLIARLDEPMDRQERAAVATLDAPSAVLRAVDYLRGNAPLALEGGSGDHTTFKVACQLKDLGLSEVTALQVLWEHWNPSCMPPWSPEELETKVANAYAYGSNAPGSSSFEAYAAGLDLPPMPAAPTAALPTGSAREWFTHGDDWNRNVPWLFYKMLPANGVALLTGPSGGGKSYIAMEIARCLATGKDFFGGVPDEVGSTIFLFGGTEGGGFAQRLAALQENRPLPIAGTHIALLAARGQLEAIEADVRQKGAEMLLTWGVPLRMVVLDTLSASGLLDDENDNAKAAMAVTLLGNLGMRLGVLFLITHHPPKTGKGERGAGAIRASSDFVLEITRDGRKAVRELDLTKARNAAERSLGAFTLEEIILATDARGREVASMSVRQSEKPVTNTIKVPAQADLFMECLDLVLSDTTEVENFDGVLAAEIPVVMDIFKKRTSIRDPSNMRRKFYELIDWHVGLALLTRAKADGREYLSKLNIN